MNFKFKIIEHGSADWKKAVQIREEVLRKPLGQLFSKKELDEEKNHIHVVGYVKDRLVSTAVLVEEGTRFKMQRVVVLDNLRNKNIGSKMMDFCEAYALEKGFDVIYCHARDSAVNFYLKNGYSKQGNYFNEDGIPHLKMILKLGKINK